MIQIYAVLASLSLSFLLMGCTSGTKLDNQATSGDNQTASTRNSTTTPPAPSPDSKSLDLALKAAVEKVIGPDMQPQGVKVEEQKLFADYADLNGDGVQDAIVIMSSSYWCGTGGCTMFVFEGRDQAFSLVSRSSLVRPPLTVSATKTNGWQDLILEVSGGGMPSKTVALKFDGKQYPLNPSDQPSLPENTPIQGKVLFPEGSEPRTIAELSSP